jgi:dTDP-4-amino-4,6-dideoxygalactose transaminase
MRVPFADTAIINTELIHRVTDVLASGRFIGGTEVVGFEERWASYCGASHCVGTSSGSAALTATLKAMLPQGSKVIIPEFSFAATLFSVLEAGMTPVFCPVEATGLMNMNVCKMLVSQLKHVQLHHEKIGIVVVHLYGQRVEIPKALLQNTMIPVIEDACQAHGITLQGMAACFSFYPSKNLGAAGDAGAVVTNNFIIKDAIYRLCNYGDTPGNKYEHTLWGSNQRLDAIQAAVLDAKLPYLDAQNNIRRQQALTYQDVGVPTIATALENYFHLYPIRVFSDDVDYFIDSMSNIGVDIGRHYPYSLPDIYNRTVSETSIATRLADEVVTLPIGPHLSNEQIEFVASSLQRRMFYDDIDGCWQRRPGVTALI